jgi:tetratricopeptide (TPR) repeat protein
MENAGQPNHKTNAGAWALPAIALVSLIVHLLFLYEYSHHTSFLVPVVDSQLYDDMARQIAARTFQSSQPYFEPPLFPNVLAAIYILGGSSVAVGRIALSLVGVLTCVLTFLVARRLFGAKVAAIAGFAAALYGPMVFFDAQLLPAGLATCLGMALLWVVLRAVDEDVAPWWFAAGVTLGVCALAVPTFLAILAVVIGWLASQTARGGRWKAGAQKTGWLILGTALAIAPVTVRNHLVSRQLVLISTNGGINLYLGNNEDAFRTMAIRPGLDWDYLQQEPLRHGVYTAVGADHFFAGKSLDFARANPVRFLRTYAYKLRLLVNARELPRTFDIYMYRPVSKVLSMLTWRAGPFAFPAGVVIPLAALGMIVACRRDRRALLLAGYAVVYALAVALFFVSARHRLVVVPVLLIFAALGVVWLFTARVGVGARAVGVALVLAAGLSVNSRITAPTDGFNFEAELEVLMGVRAQQVGNYKAAEGHYLRATEIDANHADAYNQLGKLRAEQGRVLESVASFEQAIARSPDFAEAHNNLGRTFALLGRVDEALAEYQVALALRPNLGLTHLNIALTELGRGRTEAAVESLRRATAVDPACFEAYNVLAWIWATHPRAELRNGAGAIRMAEALVNAAGTPNPAYFDTLAASYAEAGRFQDAVRSAEIGVRLAEDAGQRLWAGKARARMAVYLEGKPYRDPDLGKGSGT